MAELRAVNAPELFRLAPLAELTGEAAASAAPTSSGPAQGSSGSAGCCGRSSHHDDQVRHQRDRRETPRETRGCAGRSRPCCSPGRGCPGEAGPAPGCSPAGGRPARRPANRRARRPPAPPAVSSFRAGLSNRQGPRPAHPKIKASSAKCTSAPPWTLKTASLPANACLTFEFRCGGAPDQAHRDPDDDQRDGDDDRAEHVARVRRFRLPATRLAAAPGGTAKPGSNRPGRVAVRHRRTSS